MKQISYLSNFLSWLIGFAFGSMLSGAVWDELNYQITHRGLAQKVYHVLIAYAARMIPENQRREYLKMEIANIEFYLSEKRHLAALIQRR